MMKSLLQILLIIILSGCSSSNNVKSIESNSPNSWINQEAPSYTIENSDGSKSKIKSHFISTLNVDDYETLKNHLNHIYDNKIDFGEHIIINFIDNDPKKHIDSYQVPWDIFYGNIKKDLAKLGKLNHFWIINPRVRNLNYYHDDKIQWIQDKDDVLRKLFFEYNGLNGGFVIIKPNANYFIKVGEYRKSDILEAFKEFK
ncbi:hypothetical protein NLM59_01830 [Weeksellaceae bacterium KMM 9724]|uniref:hypothetical protein n=1 Tax=Profundicola chukchiensis TaxID=2961959 RepID=UPI0024392211|nr:hypothetical protein [Profundicola chukchiensis]MDG4949651.1 hypothetical protein [Profundicola chukchiensis]